VLRSGANAVHRTARLLEIDGLESGRRPPNRPKMPLAFLNKVKQRISIRIARGQGRRERVLEWGERGDQVIPMVDGPVRHTQIF
jgi:hypothetical protein